MHNRKKQVAPLPESELKDLRDKCSMYKSLVEIIFQRRKCGDYSMESLSLTGKLLKLNPDFYSLWNYRREILLNAVPQVNLNSVNVKVENEVFTKLELELTNDAIRRNPKSYGAWHHRLWVVDHFVVDFKDELELCRLFLQQDHRNFHCWNYRRAIFHRSGFLSELELDYSTEKIQENFSNYSALHHRSIYIQDSELPVRSLLDEEFLLVENAIFTEPDDQSAWWYHQFLIQFAFKRMSINGESQQLLCDLLKDQYMKLQNLLSIEPESKWCMTGIVYLLHAILMRSETTVLLESHEVNMYKAQKEDLLLKLIQIDPNHSARYSYLLKN